MPKRRTNSTDYMSIGDLSKLMGTTVRTLQYYDKTGLLYPTTESEGGRRLYTHKDAVKLQKIQALKSLGFSLNEIKDKLHGLDTPTEVIDLLTKQGVLIQQKIIKLKEALAAIEALKTEVSQIQQVDFKKYADIIINLQMNNDYYWLIKHFDDELLDNVRHRFDKESASKFATKFNHLNEQILLLKEQTVAPSDKQAQILAADFWQLIIEFTGGDMSLIPKLMALEDTLKTDTAWQTKQKTISNYLQSAFEVYFQNNEIKPFKEG